jgi:chromosome condensin MukBEF MukE localization factor
MLVQSSAEARCLGFFERGFAAGMKLASGYFYLIPRSACAINRSKGL